MVVVDGVTAHGTFHHTHYHTHIFVDANRHKSIVQKWEIGQ